MNAQPDPAVIEMLVELACRAPSVHNSQPWKWEYSEGYLDLRTDRSRLLNTIDPSGRQLTISCGAALDHLQRAATTFKWTSEVTLFPTPRSSEHLARIRFIHGAHPQSHEFDLLTAINRRRSDRRPFGDVPADRALSPHARREVAKHDTAATLLSPQAREALAQASKLSAGVRKYDATYQAELRWWAGHEFKHHGIPARALARRSDSASVQVGREFPEPAAATRQHGTARDESAIVLLSTESDSSMDWLQCGRALSSLLLESTAAGLATCPLTHMTEQPGSRSLVQSLAPSTGVAQVLVRIGTTQMLAASIPTPRQAVSSVLSVQGGRKSAGEFGR